MVMVMVLNSAYTGPLHRCHLMYIVLTPCRILLQSRTCAAYGDTYREPDRKACT